MSCLVSELDHVPRIGSICWVGVSRSGSIRQDTSPLPVDSPQRPATSTSGSMALSLPKLRLPSKGAARPLLGEGGSPFEPGQVRGTHFSAGDVGVSTITHLKH